MVYVVALLALFSLFTGLFALWFLVWTFTISGRDYPVDDAHVQISD